MLRIEHISKTFHPGTVNEKKALDDCLVPKKKLDDKQLHPYFNLDLI